MFNTNPQSTVNIRNASVKDSVQIYKVHIAAFPDEENTRVATLATDLLAEEKTNPEILSIVAETRSQVVAHMALSPVKSDSNGWRGYILAPLGVLPEYQHQKIGSQLIQHGISMLKDLGVNMLFVYGDPGFYKKFGFSADTASGYLPPYELQYPFGWQAMVLNTFDERATSLKTTCVKSLQYPDLW